jgi:uncharacterized protein (TIGR00730 family)
MVHGALGMLTTPLKELRLLWLFCLDYFSGLKEFYGHGPCITVYGSALYPKNHPYYALAETLGQTLARAGFTVMTGGGPGLMEAVNLGAQSLGKSLGCAIAIPTERTVNRYLDRQVTCHHFFSRKLVMARFAAGYAVLPGGYGTLDELFEIANLVRTHHLPPTPIVLVGKEYWTPLMDFMDQKLLGSGAINAHDRSLIQLADSAEEALGLIQSKLHHHAQ